MSGIYIPGMEMPKEGRLTLQISANGAVYVVNSGSITAETYTTDAVSVPPHGSLIEESKVLDIVFEWCPDDDGSVGKVGDPRGILDEIEALPTIIPAEAEPLEEDDEDAQEPAEDKIAEAISIVRMENKATVALLQRRLGVGYSEAARIMDELEARGVVGPFKGGEPRDVLPEDEPEE